MPFQGLDGVMSELACYLSTLRESEVADLMPTDPRSMVRLFPILERVEAIASAEPGPEISDPIHARRHVLAALRDLLARLARTRSVIIAIDDFQWSDADTHLLLTTLMHPPDPPPLLLVVSADEMPAVLSSALGDVRDIALAPLSSSDATALADSLLRQAGAPKGADARTLAMEAGGHPFYITELARHADSVGATAPPMRLRDAVALRTSSLVFEARRILEIVCVAAGPISWVAVQRASGVDGSEFLRHVSALRTSQLVRARRGDETQTIEPYHDHLRRGIVAKISTSARRSHHDRLATALFDLHVHRHAPEMLLRHLRGAERLREASRFAERAGHRASSAMAFARAASLFRTSLELGHYGIERTRRIRLALAWSLVNAGRGADAAQAFMHAADDAEPDVQRECYRMASQQWLITGHLASGMNALQKLLASIGGSLPSTQRRALLSLVWQRAKLATRRVRWKPKPPGTQSAEILARLGVYQAAAQSLLPMDTLRGADANARFLLLSLRVGEPHHAATALGLEAIFLCGMGARAHRKARGIFRQVLEIEDSRPNDPFLVGWSWLVDGFMSYLESRFHYAADMLKNAEHQFANCTVGTTWERNNSRLIHVFSLRYLGEIRTMRERVALYCDDARQRGDNYLLSSMRFGRNLALLASDESDEAARELASAAWVPSDDAYHLQQWYELEARAEIALYRGDVQSALEDLEPEFALLSKSLFIRIKIVRSVSRWLRARLLLAAAAGPADRQLPRLARQLERERIGYADVFAALIRAGIAARNGDADATAARLRRAVGLSEDVGMKLCAAAGRRHLGRLIGGDEGSALVASAEGWMAAEEIRDPAAISEIVAPGLR